MEEETEARLNQIFAKIMGSKLEIMGQVNSILGTIGLKENRDYIWSLQGPTLIYIGDRNPFDSLDPVVVQRIKHLGVSFLTEPVFNKPNE
jgi:hypothetical protein